MMTIKQLVHHPSVERLRHLPKRVYVVAGICFTLVAYSVLFIVPLPVGFSYENERTCIPQLTLFPRLQKSVGNQAFNIYYEREWSVAEFPILATQSCAIPLTTPERGSHWVTSAPFGVGLFAQNYLINVPETPSIDTDVFKAPIPATKAVTLHLSTPDKLYTYRLKIGDKSVVCTPVGAAISCDIPSLGLAQGKEYALKLTRQFSETPAITVFSSKVTTLTATIVSDSSIKAGETVFARPQEFSFTADKPLRSAEVTLTKVSEATPITVVTSVKGSTITVKIEKELERDTDYVVAVKHLESKDGSGLVEPYVVPFHMSGGPKVVSVNAGKSGVGASDRVVVTFDQALSEAQDISKLVTFTGGAAVVSRSGNTIVYQLQSLPLCTPFTMAIEKGTFSQYDIPSSETWSYTSRTICYTTSVYGTSVKGRGLVAYYFGSSGSTTMYVGAIHGNESSSSGLMKSWINHLEAHPSLFDGRRIVVIPTINPDGIANGTRTNARGVNLNRNFPTDNWVADINDTDGQHAGGGGASGLSEPESSALASITTSVRPRLLLSFHAIGSLVVGDPGGYSAGYASQYASMVGYRNATGNGDTFDYDITGAYEDWSYAKQGIPSMVVELGSYGYYDFSYHRAALESMLR